MSGITPYNARRATFLRHALHLIGVPYVWNGKSAWGVDCSGLVTYSLYRAGGPDLRATHNTDKLWKEFAEVDAPVAGDLAFYGGKAADDVEHVMVCLSLGMVFGACGGDSRVTSIELAKAKGARVRVYDDIDYRDDFRGFRRIQYLIL